MWKNTLDLSIKDYKPTGILRGRLIIHESIYPNRFMKERLVFVISDFVKYYCLIKKSLFSIIIRSKDDLIHSFTISMSNEAYFLNFPAT